MFKRLTLLLFAVLIVAGCQAATPAEPANLRFDATFNLAPEDEFVIDLLVENESATPYPADDAFEGEWFIVQQDDAIRARGVVHDLGAIPAEGQIRPVLWQGQLEPGSYTLTWGAPDHGAVEIPFEVTQGGISAGEGTQLDQFTTPAYVDPTPSL